MCRPGHDDLRRGGHRREASATQPQRGGLRPNGKSKLWGLYIYIYIHMCVYIYIYIWSGFNLLVFRAVWDCGVSGLSQSVTTLLLTRLVLPLALVLLLIVVVTSKKPYLGL